MEQTELPPLLWEPLPSFTKLRYLVAICVIKAFLTVGWSLRRLLVMLGFAPKFSGSPAFSKAYICRPKLTHRFFYPKSYQSGETLPVYINIHGGGFAFGTPEHDDEFCVFFSNNFNLLVISIDYSLAPWSTFPTPTEDVAAVMLAILADSTLPIDHSRVAIGGFSAGGNLALSASQLPALQGKIKAAVMWFAPVDWSVDYAYKLASRAYKRPEDIDRLAAVAPIFNNVYLPTGTDQRDPLLSILYAKREVLPEWIYGISAEYDMLGDELKRMMVQLAGSHQPPLESEQQSFERDGGKIKWTMAKDAEHTFTHWWLKRGKVAHLAKPAAEQSFIDAGRWLTERVFAQ